MSKMTPTDEEFKRDYTPRIREARLRMNLTQTELAELLGVSMRSVQEWERGNALPRPRQRRRLARILFSDDDERVPA